MKNLISVILLILIVQCFFSSCSDSNKEHKYVEMTELDFGEGTYRPNPFKFLDNIPPFSWMGMPDSVKRETELEITFNEDAIRSRSSGQLAFVDQNGNKVNGIEVGNKISDKITIDAKEGNAVIPVRFTVNPEVGDSVLQGSLVVIGNELDQVNEVKLSSMATPIASWSLKQETGINWLRWIILILLAAIILAIVALIFYGLFKLGVYIFVALSSAVESLSAVSLPSFKFYKKRDNKKNKQEKKLTPYLRDRQFILRSNAIVKNKAVALYEILLYVDYNLIHKPEYRHEQISLLDYNIREALDELWVKFYASPKNNGRWSGEAKNSIWIPDDNYTPPRSSNYNNEKNKSWKTIKKEYGFSGLRFDRGIPQFKDIAKYKVNLPNFETYINPLKPDKRTALHIAAFKALAEKLHTSYEAVDNMKCSETLMWHEDVDCCTIYLVPQEIHGNIIPHFGGIGMLGVLRKYGFV